MDTRQRYGGAVLATLLLMAVAAAATRAQVPTRTDIVGTYSCRGVNSDGSAYHGVVTIVRRADAYYLLWELQPGVTALGVGIREGDTLGVSYYGPNTGIIVYRIDGNQLIGRWTMPGAGALASETLTLIEEIPSEGPVERPDAPPGSGPGASLRL